jgi:hypothetical protein
MGRAREIHCMPLSGFKQTIEVGFDGAFELVNVRSLAKLIKAMYLGSATRTLSARNRRLIEKSGLFDAGWYLKHAPEAAASKLDPLEHYFYVGWKKGLSPSPHFDAAWYRAFYNDVGAAGWEPLLHFIRYGKSRGRSQRGIGGSIYDGFESLGDDCEFGNVQRHFGSNKLGLFRFTATDIDGLIAAFDHGLDRLISDDTVEIVREHGEYRTRVAPYGMLFHTHVATAAATLGDIKAHEVRRLRLLARKFVEDLEEGRKIFVYKAEQISVAKMLELASRLRRFGPNHLLCVTATRDARKLGRLDVLSETLALGYVDRFDWDMSKCSVALWENICLQAHALWQRPERTALVA